MITKNADQKAQIFFSRPYRHLKPDSQIRLIFLIGLVLTCVLLFLFFYTKISYLLAFWVRKSLSSAIPESFLDIAYGEFLPLFGGVYYVHIRNIMPSFQELALNLAVTLLLLFICLMPYRNSKGGTPVSIYLAIAALTHLIAVIFFMFAGDFFAYSSAQYSELYIKQQVGIWLSFLVIAGLITGILGYGSIILRLVTYCTIMAFSFIFGCLRCLTSLFIISTISSLYMATLFFTLGPLFDFLYLVCFYSIYINIQIKHFSQGEGRLKWHWL